MQRKCINRVIRNLIFSVVLILVMTGCCMSHDWKEADCLHPKTCQKCGKTEGEVSDHLWIEATCKTPQKCSVCGNEIGEALGHVLTKADYEQASVCTRCGEKVGDPLQADFEKYDLGCKAKLNEIYDLVTQCNDEPEKQTLSKVTFSNYRIFDSDEQHDAQPGYEWRAVDVTILFYDQNAEMYGWNVGEAFLDYYDIKEVSDFSNWDEDDILNFKICYQDEDYAQCKWQCDRINRMCCDIEKSEITAWTVSCLVPKNYDGCVYALRNCQIEWNEEQYFYDLDNSDTIFFRFDNNESVNTFSPDSVEDINLTLEEAMDCMVNLYINLPNYFDETVSEFFDFDGDYVINQDESAGYIGWCLGKYNTENRASLGEMDHEQIIRAASDYLNGRLDVPEELYIPTLK